MALEKSFVHLHCHADGSMLDGLALIADLVPAAEKLGMPAIAVTDHGSDAALYDLYKVTKDSTVRPIYGIEAYMSPDVPRSHRSPVKWSNGGEDDVSGGGAYTHATLLAETNQGLRNLFALSSESYLSGVYYKPRMDIELLEKYHDGIIATTGCPSGEVQTWLRIGDYEKAKAAAAKFMEIFGRDNYYVELMNHGLGIEKRVIPDLIRISKELRLPAVATNDLHYVNKSDARFHEALLCISTRDRLSNPNRFKFDAEDFYLKTPQEMRALWDTEVPDACDNTLVIAERCTATFVVEDRLMPRYPVPEGYTEHTWFEKEVWEGLHRRFPNGISPDHESRAKYEIGIINDLNFPGYFLVVADFINWAKDNGIGVGPGRGCLSGDSRVLTPTGFKLIKNIQVGDTVFDGEGNPVIVPAVFAYPCEEPLIEIKSHYGAAGNKMTADHKVLVSKANKETRKQKIAQGIRYAKPINEPQWIRADEVEVGDLVCTPRLSFPVSVTGFPVEKYSETPTNKEYPHSDRKIAANAGVHRSTVRNFVASNGEVLGAASQKVSDYLDMHELTLDGLVERRTEKSTLKTDYVKATWSAGFLIGIFISDGWVRKDGSASVGFAQRRSEDANVIPNTIKDVFGVEPTHSDSTTSDLRQYFINHKGVAKLFRDMFPDYESTSKSKYIPEQLFETPEEFRKGLLEGLWYGDGSHSGYKSKYTTVSPRLAEGVFTLLASLGLPASIKESKRVEKRPEYRKNSEGFWTEYSVTTAHYFDIDTMIMGVGFDGDYTYYRVREINEVPSEGIVYDFTVPTTHSYATDSYIVHNSGAGSIVAYALRITELDPISNGLLFERFLNPERVSPPDIDVDFDDKRRGEVIEYCKQKYGEDKVVNIGTFMKIKAKAAIKDAARVLDEPYATGDKLTKVYPAPVAGEDMSLRDVYNPEHARYKEADEFRKLVASDPAFMKVLDIAKGLEGVKRGHGMHAAGVIMCCEPVINYVPLMKQDADAPIMTQFEYPTCEKLGLIKMDFLGLSNLSTINECLRLIKQNKGIDITSADIWEDMTDPATYKLLQGGETLGVFQLDSAPIRSLLRLMAPDRFNDISAVLALYRPGPMAANAHIDYADRKNGRTKIEPIHPELEEPLRDIISDTYGVICFQEQVMAIAQVVASYSLGQADLLRKAMGKKDKVIVDKEFKPFKEAALKNGYSEEAINTLWEVVVPFASYAFNRAHSAAYGYISYETAYLKANYPVEYMAALLTTNATNTDKTALYLGECRRMGIPVLAPDVNESFENYNAVGDSIRVGFIAIKGVGHGLVQAMIDARAEHGRFTGFGDFLFACPAQVLKKNAIEALIKAGGFDSFGYTRRALVLIHDDAVTQALALKKTQKAGQDSLFAGTGADPGSDLVVPDIAEWDRTTLLRFERDMLGLYVTDHPLNGFDHLLRKVAPMPIADVKESTAATGTEVKVAGLLSGIERRKTKAKGENWAILQVEDLGGSIVANAFPRTYRKYEDLLVEDTVVILEGKIEHRDDGSTSIVVNDIRPVDLVALADPDSVPFIVQVQEAQLSADLLDELKDTLRMFAGPTPVQMRVVRMDGGVAVLALGSEFGVRRGSPLVSGLKALLGVDCIIQS